MSSTDMHEWWDKIGGESNSEQAEWLEAARGGLTATLAGKIPADHRDGKPEPWVYMTGSRVAGQNAATWHLSPNLRSFLEAKLRAPTDT